VNREMSVGRYRVLLDVVDTCTGNVELGGMYEHGYGVPRVCVFSPQYLAIGFLMPSVAQDHLSTRICLALETNNRSLQLMTSLTVREDGLSLRSSSNEVESSKSYSTPWSSEPGQRESDKGRLSQTIQRPRPTIISLSRMMGRIWAVVHGHYMGKARHQKGVLQTLRFW
jgi:hypothetical protein